MIAPVTHFATATATQPLDTHMPTPVSYTHLTLPTILLV